MNREGESCSSPRQSDAIATVVGRPRPLPHHVIVYPRVKQNAETRPGYILGDPYHQRQEVVQTDNPLAFY